MNQVFQTFGKRIHGYSDRKTIKKFSNQEVYHG